MQEQRYAIKFCVKLKKSATETFASLTEAYGDATLSRTMVFIFFIAFKEGRENVEDDPRSGRPISSTNDENVEVVRSFFMSVSHTFHVPLFQLCHCRPYASGIDIRPLNINNNYVNYLAPDFKESREVGSRLRIVNSKVHLAASSSRQSLKLYGRMTSVYRVTNQRHLRGDKGGIFLLFVGRDLVRISALVKSFPIRVTKSHAHFNLIYSICPGVN
jgi:hypothetical protein